MTLKEVIDRLTPVGYLDPEKRVVLQVHATKRDVRYSEDGGCGIIYADIAPDGTVTVKEMHIDPDMFEKIKAIFEHSDVKVEEMPWC